MSELGQKRRFDRVLSTSGLPQLADILSVRQHVSKVPCMDGARGARGILHFSEAFGCSHVSGL